MNISEYCDTINVNLVVRRYHNQKERWSASIENAEVKQNGCLLGAYGNGNTPMGAIADYIKQIRGETIVLNAMSELRREFTVPSSLELP